MADGATVLLRLKVSAELGFGEEVYVSGNVEALGFFDVQKAVQLVTSPENFPVWYNKADIRVPAGHLLKYKFCVFSGGVFRRWEALEEERLIKLTDSHDIAARHELDVPGVSEKPKEKGGISASTALSPAMRRHSNWQLFEDIKRSTLQQSDGVIVVTYQLPVVLSRASDGSWIVEWDEDHLFATKDENLHILYVGTPRSSVPIRPEDEENIQNALKHFRCVPVFLAPDLATKFYEGYCVGTLWPVFHNVVDVYGARPTRWWNRNSQQDLWQAYTTVNRLFAQKVVEVFCDKYLVWVHDIHLLVLPSFLSRRLHGARIGLFIHTPFPSSEIFKTLSIREDLLRGMLCADQVGFHIFEYTRHFLTCCRRLLGVQAELQPSGRLEMEYNGRTVVVTSLQVGIDQHLIRSTLASEAFQRAAEEYRKKYAGQVVVVGIDEVDRLKGLPLKLRGFEQFLTAHPEWRGGRCKLVQIGLSSGLLGSISPVDPEKVDAASVGDDPQSNYSNTPAIVRSLRAKQAQISSTVLGMVTSLNKRFGGTTMSAVASSAAANSTDAVLALAAPSGDVVEYSEVAGLSLVQRLALFSVADVMLVTCIREGMNQLPLEFVAAHSSDRPGSLIASEFGAVSRLLIGAFCVSPWNSDEVGEALFSCLTMNRAEAVERYLRSFARLQDNSVMLWAMRVLRDLKASGTDSSGSLESSGGSDRSSEGGTGRVQRTADSNGGGGGGGGGGVEWSGISGQLVAAGDSGNLSGAGGGAGAARSHKMQSVGLGMGFRMLQMATQFEPLPSDKVLKDYKAASRRVICLDFGGTLMSDPAGDATAAAGGHAGEFRPLRVLPESTRQILHLLCLDPRNTVFIISGVEKTELMQSFGSVPWLGLAAEHGFFYRWGTAAPAFADPVWETLGGIFDDSWKEVTAHIMAVYTHRTNGAFVEVKGSALLWQYRDADPEFGLMQAKELEDHLTGVLKNFSVVVLAGKGYVEVRPAGVDKGRTVELILNKAMGTGAGARHSQPAPDFVLVIGDDSSDECMFQTVEALRGELNARCCASFTSAAATAGAGAGRLRLFTATVGKKPSEARNYVNDPDEVLELLTAMTRLSTKSNHVRAMSMIDLAALSASERGRPSFSEMAPSFALRGTSGIGGAQIGGTGPGSPAQPTEKPVVVSAAGRPPPVGLRLHSAELCAEEEGDGDEDADGIFF